jgi:uncharacterized protein (TIGR02246 family)
MPFEGPTEDRLAIHELYGAYADATMRADRDLYLSLWADDGVRAAPDSVAEGKAAIAAHWDGVWGGIKQMGFFGEVGSIVVDGDTASARVHCHEIVEFKDGNVWKVIGRYEDRLARIEGRWVFARKDYTLVMREG